MLIEHHSNEQFLADIHMPLALDEYKNSLKIFWADSRVQSLTHQIQSMNRPLRPLSSPMYVTCVDAAHFHNKF